MSSPTQYVVRSTGEVRSDVIHAYGFLDWCHNSRLGWLLTSALLCRGPVSRLYGWWHRRSWTRRKVRPYAERLGIDLSECVRDVGSFGSLADLVERDIDLRRRPIDPRDDVCVSPVDGRVLVLPRVSLEDRLEIKHAPFDLRGLLADDALAAEHDGGAVVVCRLYLNDYHHFHFPAGGVPGRTRSVPGTYFAVTPYSRRRRVPFYSRNHRMVTVLDSDRFGRLTMVEVGAFTIGSIEQRFAPGRRVEKGARKGCFRLGASVVVLLFAPGAVTLDEDLVERSREGHETYVRLGESLGHSSAS